MTSQWRHMTSVAFVGIEPTWTHLDKNCLYTCKELSFGIWSVCFRSLFAIVCLRTYRISHIVFSFSLSTHRSPSFACCPERNSKMVVAVEGGVGGEEGVFWKRVVRSRKKTGNWVVRRIGSPKKKVNDVVQKKPKTPKKTDKQRKKNDGVLKQNEA